MKTVPSRGGSAFNALYDPVSDASLGRGSDYCPTYWIGTAGPAPADDGPVTGDFDVECAVIGSGYTGLNAAIALTRDLGIETVVLEAHGTAYGCSTRNGGQAQFSAGRLKRSQWIERWGLDTARSLHAEMLERISTTGAPRSATMGSTATIRMAGITTWPTRPGSCRGWPPRPRCCATSSATAPA